MNQARIRTVIESLESGLQKRIHEGLLMDKERENDGIERRILAKLRDRSEQVNAFSFNTFFQFISLSSNHRKPQSMSPSLFVIFIMESNYYLGKEHTFILFS